MTGASPASTRLAELGEEYFRVKHTYDPFNASLLGLTEFDGLVWSPTVEVSSAAETSFAGLGREVADLDADGRLLLAPVAGAGRHERADVVEGVAPPVGDELDVDPLAVE